MQLPSKKESFSGMFFVGLPKKARSPKAATPIVSKKTEVRERGEVNDRLVVVGKKKRKRKSGEKLMKLR